MLISAPFIRPARVAAQVVNASDDIPYGNGHISLIVMPSVVENRVAQ